VAKIRAGTNTKEGGVLLSSAGGRKGFIVEARKEPQGGFFFFLIAGEGKKKTRPWRGSGVLNESGEKSISSLIRQKGRKCRIYGVGIEDCERKKERK